MREITVNENDAGQRLDKFISKLMPKLPQSMMYRGLRKKCVKLNGRHVKDGSVRLKSGDELNLYFSDEFFEKKKNFRYVKPDIDIVYEDDNILVVNKAVGVVVHEDAKGTPKTLIAMVQSYLYDKGEYDPYKENTFKPALCNRLDRNTGGLVIAAKNAESLRSVNEAIRNRRIRKFYMAVVEGYPEGFAHLEGYMTRTNKVTVVSDEVSELSSFVSLDYKVKSRKNGYSLLEVELHTGRTHQIRSQLSAIGFPIAGDTKYGGHGAMFRQALWSVRLTFDFDEHSYMSYMNGHDISVTAPFEKDFDY